MADISIISKETAQQVEHIGNSFKLGEPVVVVIDVAPEEVASIDRSGNNLTITLKNGEQIYIENYFAADNSLVFKNDQNQLLLAQVTDASGAILDPISYLNLEEVTPLLYGAESEAFVPWLVGAVGIGGLAAAVTSTSDSSDDTRNDITPPQKPIITENNGDGLSGTGEAGSTVIVKDSQGNQTEIKVGEDGKWSIEPNPLNEGEQGTIEAVDPAGNSSGQSPVTGGDQTVPQATLDTLLTNDTTPGLSGTVNDPAARIEVSINGSTYQAINNGDGSWSLADNIIAVLPEGLINVTVTATDAAGNRSAVTGSIRIDTTAPAAPLLDAVNVTDPISGTAEAGARIVVTYPNGTTASTVADATGNWSVANPGNLSDGQQISVVASDAAGNSSAPASATVDADITAPSLEFIVIINADGSATLSGTTEPGTSVIVQGPDGAAVPVNVAPDGSISGSIAAPALAGNYTATATDINGNTATDTATATDSTPPAVELNVVINADGSATLSGTTEPGTSVIVQGPDGAAVPVNV
ncbi:Ig-like domain-containing protein, partial [Acinetobacter radioresistens]|uniref:Ig-like domain-containing protein n=2 Tax=Acinetobacter TaxID=469 RepID=UPI0021CD6C3A